LARTLAARQKHFDVIDWQTLPVVSFDRGGLSVDKRLRFFASKIDAAFQQNPLFVFAPSRHR
jgi:hypothetical protein